MSRKILVFLLGLFFLMLPVFSQEKLVLDGWCVYDGSALTGDIYGFSSDQEANLALSKVMKVTGLEPNFVLQAANVPNAVAAISGQKRYILYSQEFMRNIAGLTKTDWSSISILAHEVGHHLQGHTLQSGGSRPPIELEADKFSGFILHRLGATLEQSQIAVRAISNDAGTATHPAKSARLAAITNGWINDEELSNKKPGSSINPESKPEQIPQNYPETSNQPQITFIARAVFNMDPVAYYVTSNNDIIAKSPVNNQFVIVGKKIPPTLPGFAWMYATPSFIYGVDPSGAIWTRNQFGQLVKIGFISNPY